MIHQVCPNPALWQQLYPGPLGAHVDTFAQQMLGQGYASSTAKYAMRVLAAFSTWLQRQGLTVTDLNEQRVEDFLYDHPWRRRPRLRIPRIPATQSMGRLPLNPREACHPVHGNPATQSTARLPPTPGEACHRRSTATLGGIFLV